MPYQSAYIRLFNQGADGIIYQIYPNSFDNGLQKTEANEVLPIPNDRYQKEFVFKVQGALGNEIVMAVASNEQLPELPGKDVQFFGLKQMAMTLKEIKKAYTDHAQKNGLSLASDFIPLVTRN